MPNAALAAASAAAGLIPADAAATIGLACRASGFDVATIAQRAVAHASPVVPLVDDLRAAVPEPIRRYVHAGATSQDIVDTATCLTAKAALAPIVADLSAIGSALAELAATHAADVQIGRTLLQQAQPTTFGLVCAGWLGSIDAATNGLRRVRDQRLAVQLGGATGTQAGFDGHGPRIAAEMADRLDLADPGWPWHTDRQRIGELAAAAALAAGALALIGRNIAMLTQTEVGEASEDAPGRSSAMPHKRNPARSVLAVACAEQVPGTAAAILAGLAGEAQRAIGGWQAEAPAVRHLLRLLGGAAMHCRAAVTGLRVDTGRMRMNVANSAATDDVTDVIAAARTLIDRHLADRQPIVSGS